METSEEVNEPEYNAKVLEEFEPIDEVNPGLQKCSVDLANLVSSCYCETPCSVSGNGPLCKSSIHNGDTLQHRREIGNLSIYILNELKNYSTSLLHVSPSATISSLKGMLYRDRWNCVNQFSKSALALSFDNTILNESRTLADYSIQNYDVIKLHVCTISIGVPTYAKMEQVLFMPEDTIAVLKNKVKIKNPDLEDTAKIRKIYPIGLRGAVMNTTGDAMFFLYLDLFSEKMKIFINEVKDGHHCYYSSFLGSEYTGDQVWKIISREFSSESISKQSFPKSYCCDTSWTQTFAPQIQAQPHSSNTPIPLFFFPLRTKIVHFRVPKKPMLTIPQFISLFSEKALGMKGVKRYLYHPHTDKILQKTKNLINCLDVLTAPPSEPYSVILIKPLKKHHKCLIPPKHAGFVGILWPTGNIKLKVNLSDTVNCLQERIEDKIVVPFSMQKLMFDGKPMLGNCTLNEIGIAEGSEIHLHPILDFE